MIKNKGLTFKLLLFVLSSIALIFSFAFAYNYYFTRRTLLKTVRESAKNLAYATTEKIQLRLVSVEKALLNSAPFILKRAEQQQDIQPLLKLLVEKNPEIYGSIFAFEPYAFHNKKHYAPYVGRDGEKRVAETVLGDEAYDYFIFDWYQMAKELGRAEWSEPYYDEGGANTLLSTYSFPIYRDEQGGSLLGIFTADVSLNWLKAIVSTIKIYRTGYAFLLTQNGVFVTHPDKRLIMRESIFSVAEGMKDPFLREIGRDMIRGNEGFVRITDFFTGRKSWLYYVPLVSNGWTLGVVYPEAELFADVWTLSLIMGGIAFGGLVLISLTVAVIARRVTAPLKQLAQTTEEISKGNLDIDLPEPKSGDEIGVLTQSFKEMKFALKDYINHLAQTTAAKERIESELKIASNIQMSFLPKRFPPFPEKSEFEIFARIIPAKEVGGDLYDFFLLGEESLFFAIGDVSGKGVPAALFMAVTKTLLKGTADVNLQPGDILQRVNNELCQDNESCMFVTAFCGVLNYRTGELLYSNAGHNPPLLVRANGEVNLFEVTPGFVLGGVENFVYETRRAKLDPGDRLLMYTDGVTEAGNSDGEFFGERRLASVAERCESKDVAKCLHSIPSVQTVP